MRITNLKFAIVLGLTTVMLGIATPSFGKAPEGATRGDFLNSPVGGCQTDEGYGRRLPCESGAAG